MHDTKARAAALARLARLEARLRDLGRSRLAAIESERMRLGDDLKAIFEALEAGPFAYGAPAKPGLNRARAAHIRLDALRREEGEARRKSEGHGLRTHVAEKAAAKAAARHRDDKERKALLDLVERAIARGDASQT